MHDSSLVTVAAAQYPVEFVGHWGNYVKKITGFVSEAARQGAQILLFPEYACMELVSLFGPEVYSSLTGQLEALQTLAPDFRQLHRNLAIAYGVYIVAASFPIQLDNGSYRNRAYFCTPDGAIDYQDKLIMTRFERELWSIAPGDEIKVFNTPYGPLGITICYDAEFPLLARRQVELGAKLILAPSCTDTLAGYHRVRIGCQARALENQCYVVMAPLVGEIDWSEAIDINVGAAGVFTPVDYGFPHDGVLALGAMNQPQWLITQLDLARINQVRHAGQVFNYQDWEQQWPAYSTPTAAIVTPNTSWLTPALVTSSYHEAARRSLPLAQVKSRS
ncbi:MAG: carbon-nitrogen hydrolase family protein [Caldilineaceae bacterium]